MPTPVPTDIESNVLDNMSSIVDRQFNVPRTHTSHLIPD